MTVCIGWIQSVSVCGLKFSLCVDYSVYVLWLQRVKKALLLSYNVHSGKAKVTEEDRKEIRRKLDTNDWYRFYFNSLMYTEYGIQAQLARTFVDDVFAGRLVSTVVCQECGNVSQRLSSCSQWVTKLWLSWSIPFQCSTIHETFLDLSLPIADDKVGAAAIHWFSSSVSHFIM